MFSCYYSTHCTFSSEKLLRLIRSHSYSEYPPCQCSYVTTSIFLLQIERIVKMRVLVGIHVITR